jgi:hypothetical protein
MVHMSAMASCCSMAGALMVRMLVSSGPTIWLPEVLELCLCNAGQVRPPHTIYGCCHCGNDAVQSRPLASTAALGPASCQQPSGLAAGRRRACQQYYRTLQLVSVFTSAYRILLVGAASNHCRIMSSAVRRQQVLGHHCLEHSQPQPPAAIHLATQSHRCCRPLPPPTLFNAAQHAQP